MDRRRTSYLFGLVLLLGRGALHRGGNEVVILTRRDPGPAPRLVVPITGKEQVPKHREPLLPQGRHHVKNTRLLTRLGKPRRGRD